MRDNIILGISLSLGITVMVILSRMAHLGDASYIDIIVIHTFVMLMLLWFGQLFLMNWKRYEKAIPNLTLRCVVSVLIVSGIVYGVLEMVKYILDITQVVKPLPLEEERFYRWSIGRIVAWNAMFLWILHSQKNVAEKNKAQLELSKAKAAALEMKLSSFREQLSPHFMFNTLNTLSSMTEDVGVQVFVARLADVYRYMLLMKDRREVSVKDELEFTQAYWYIIKERFEDAVDLRVDIKEETMQKHIPPLTFQVLVENAIKHNKATVSSPLTITIADNDEAIIVSNNIQVKQTLVESTGIGLRNLSEQYKLLYGKQIEITENEMFKVRLPFTEQ